MRASRRPKPKLGSCGRTRRRLITKAKKGDLTSRREVLKEIPDRDIVATLFHEIGPRFAEREGGYTRILKLGPRKGDGAPMARIELVERSA